MSQNASARPGAGSAAGTGSRTAIGQALFGLATAAIHSVPRDISLTSASTLATLDRSGPRRITDLAAAEGITQPSMTVLVTALAAAGLAERRADPADGRVSLVVLTVLGSDYLRARRQAGAAAFAELIDELPPGEAGALAAAVTALEHLRSLDEERRDRGSGQARGRSARVSA
jgi:DNA-binding MarR family transcriptional regulator